MRTRRLSPDAASPGRPGDAAMAAAVLLLGLVLAGSGTLLAQHLRSSAARRQSLTFESSLGVAATTTGLIVVAWWILSLLIAVTSALLERSGHRTAAAAAGGYSPAFTRRLALAAVGLQLATAPLANAATGTFGQGSPTGPGAPLPPAVAAAWAPGGATAPRATATPAPRPGMEPRWMPSPAPADPGALAPAQLRAQDPATGEREVTVRDGDSLWGICASELGPLASDVDIALAWPQLYQHNRNVIGPDPGLLRPGQVLLIPPGL